MLITGSELTLLGGIRSRVHLHSGTNMPPILLANASPCLDTLILQLPHLIAKALGTTGRQKQLSLQRLDNVRTCLALATLTVQVAMIANSIWGLPLRNISTIATAFT